MKKIEKKKINKNIIASAVIIVATLFAGAVFIYAPFVNKAKNLRSNILQERDRNILIGKIRALDKHLNIYGKRIPDGRGVSWLLSEVSDMAAKEKIELPSIKPGLPEDRGGYTKLYVILDTLSTYHQLGKFISRIESSEKFLRVESIDIKRLDMNEGFDKEESKYKAFDVKGHIVVSTIVLKE